MKFPLKYLFYQLVIVVVLFNLECYGNDFVKYTSKNGLSIDIVDCIVQDNEGFLYFGTPEGLNIFNGTSFKVFNSKNTLNFTDQVKRILPLNNDLILIGSLDKGLFIYNKLYESIVPLKIFQHGINSFLQITALQIDHEDNIWIGTLNNGLFKLSLERILRYKSEDIIDFESINFVLDKSIKSILTTQETIWAGTLKNGLFKLDLNSNSNEFIKFKTSFDDIWDIKLINDKLYIGQDGGLEIIDFKNKKSNLLLTHQKNKANVDNVITSITKDNNGKIWLSTLNDGIYTISLTTNKIIDHFINNPSDERTININKVLYSYLDMHGNLWFGTWYGGINMIRLQGKQFKNYKFKDKSNDLSKNIAWEMIPYTKDNYLLGMNGNGICTLNSSKSYFERSTFLADLEFVSDMYWIEHSNNLWVGTWENGLIYYNTKTGKRKNIFKNKDTNLRIHEINMDRHGILWIGTNSDGLYSINTNKNMVNPEQHFVYPNYNADINDGHIDIRKVIVDEDNILWIGSLNYGFLKAKTNDNGTIVNSTLIPIDAPLSKKFYNLRTLYKDNHNSIWIGYENGLVKFDVKTNALTEIIPFDNLKITGVVEVNKNEFWISSYNGLYKYDPSTEKIIHIFQNQIINSIFNEKETGTLWLTTSTGIYSFFPQDLTLGTDHPKIILSNFKENQKLDAFDNEKNILKLNYRNEIIRDYTDNSILFKVSTLFFGENKENEISFKLVDYDNEWNQMMGPEAIISYKNLPSGNYKLEVKVKNKYGILNPDVKTLNITILSPWWASVYSYIIYGIIILIILFVIKYEVSKNHQIKILKIKREKENELNDLKLSFFTNISHDIRTPLTLILAPLETLLTSDIKDSWIHHQHKIIQKNTDLLLKLINQILDFGKLDKNKMKLKSSKVNIENLINNCINQFENATFEKEIKIVLVNTTSNLDLWIDSNKMEKVFINLISNAIKYSDRKKDIIINIEKYSNNVIVDIVNYGSEIRSNDLKHVFERFYQSKYNKGGSGIGLSIVKGIIELHHGEVSVKSKSKKGTKFRIKLPLGNSHLTNEEMLVISEVSDISKNKIIEIELINDSTDKELETLLIIDDNHDIRNYIVDSLKKEFNVVDVDNGKLGIEKAEILIPSLIVCDIMMDGMDGIEVCKRLKSNIDTSHIPIILLTAKNTDEDKIAGYQEGADQYITKPFNMTLLKTRINNLLEQRRRLKEKLRLPDIEPKAFSPTSIDEKFMTQTMLIVERNISNNLLSIEDVSNEMKMSQTQFYRKIKNLTGYSASQFIRVVRLKRAAQMLSAKKYKISEVVYEVGFSSPSYFTKCFKKLYGKSPTEFLENTNI